MSGANNGREPPSAWSSYVSLPRPRRRSSIRLPNHEPHAFERRDRNKTTFALSRRRMQAAWMNQGQRSRFIKTGVLICFCLVVVYYVLGSGSNGAVKSSTNIIVPSPDIGSPANLDPEKASIHTLTTTKCTKSHSPDKPLVQYALMIDAGSTGSRIHVYRFNNCGATPELEDEIFQMTEHKPGGSGLSSFNSDAEGAAKSLDVLLKVAVDNVPEELKSCTPIAVKATAGLRKLGPELSDNILKAVRHRLETQYPFPLVNDAHGGVEVMDGKDEGVYAWITTNYLLGKIGSPENTPTAAVFDLGGGSTQIVFQPTFPQAENGGMPEVMKEGDHKYELAFGGRNFTLYQHSYLGYGLMEARNNLHRIVVENLYDTNPTSRTWLDNPIHNPCLGVGTTREIEVPLSEGHALGPSVKVTMTGPPSSGSMQLCRSLAEKTLNKDKSCSLTPCAFDGVHQPSLEKTFAHEDVYLFSYFYDRVQPLGMPEAFTLRQLEHLVGQVCAGGEAWTMFKSVPGALQELEGRPETCLDLNFMLALLHTGYEMPMDRKVRIAKKINGNELGWCLGASLPLLSQESGWSCKIREVV